MMPVMPSFFRFLRFLALAGIALILALWALATFVEPQPRPTSITIPIGGNVP